MSQEEISLEEFTTIEILEKLSDKHISFNKRLIELNVHLLCYYSDIPPYFHTKRLIPPNQHPKQGVQILDIEHIDKDDENTRKMRRPNVFRIIFDKKKLIDFKKSGKEASSMKERYTYHYNQENDQVQNQQQSINASKLTDKNGKVDPKKSKIQWVFQCKTVKERDNWVNKLITVQRLLKEQVEFEQRDEKSKNMDRNYTSQKSTSNYNSAYQHPQHQNYKSNIKTQQGEYQSNNGYNSQQNYFNGLYKIEEEDRNDKYLNSIDNNELAVSQENSHEINRSQSGEIKMSYGNNSLNNRSMMNKGGDSPSKSQINHFQGELMSHEEERAQNENQKKRQDLRQYSMNQHYELLLPSNQVKQADSTLFQNNKSSFNEDDEDKFKQLQKREEEMRKRALDEEEEKIRKEKEEVERLKKQKEEEELRIKNKLVYDSSYELQYQDQINSTNIQQQQSITENPVQIMNQSTQLITEQSQPSSLTETAPINPIKIPLSQFSNISPNRRDKIDDRFKKNYELLSLIGTFNEAAQEATKLLIEDLIFSGNLKKYFPIQIKKECPNIEQMSNEVYFDMLPSYEFVVEAKRYNNFVIKLSWNTQETIAITQSSFNDNIPSQFQEQLSYQDSSMGQIIERFINESPLITTRNNSKISSSSQVSPNKYLQVYEQFRDQVIQQNNFNQKRRSAKQREDQRDLYDYAPTFNAYTNYHGKSLSSEFKALNLINTWHMNHKSDNKSPVKVPLSCIVTYRGFKALVQSISPDAEGLVHGII